MILEVNRSTLASWLLLCDLRETRPSYRETLLRERFDLAARQHAAEDASIRAEHDAAVAAAGTSAHAQRIAELDGRLRRLEEGN